MAVRDGVRAGRNWNVRRRNRQATARFAEFWAALQQVGDAMAEAQRAVKNAEDGTWKAKRARHWEIATTDEIRGSLRRSKFSLRICAAQAKRFEPQLIEKEWRR